MDRAVFMGTMQIFKERRPFRPFSVVLLNGNVVEVDYPDAVFTRDGTGVYLSPGGVPWVFDHEGVNQIVGDLVSQAPDSATDGG